MQLRATHACELTSTERSSSCSRVVRLHACMHAHHRLVELMEEGLKCMPCTPSGCPTCCQALCMRREV
jgi:hypothetical protein